MTAIQGNNQGKGIVFNIQKFSLHDGPGIRTVVFFKGCPLECQWCSNPESMGQDPEIMTNDLKCIKCGTCITACPQKAISIIENQRRIDWAKCNQCLNCGTACPTGAIDIVGKYMSVEEAVKEIEKDVPFYNNSGGGVTFSGGEPLAQWQFLLEACRICKEKKIHVAIETTGCAQWEVLDKVLDYVDLALYDIKHLDPNIHASRVNGSNKLILENFPKTAHKVKTWLRVPVIPGFNDSEEFMHKLGDFCKNSGVERVCLLPYHTWGEPKYARLGREYAMKGISPLNEESLQGLKEVMESHGLATTIGW